MYRSSLSWLFREVCNRRSARGIVGGVWEEVGDGRREVGGGQIEV